jgi:hypothetical protein
MVKNFNLNYFKIQFTNEQIRVILITIVIFVVILLFRTQFAFIFEKIIIFGIIFLLILIISKNLIITVFSSCIIFLLLNLMMGYKYTVENFQNEIEKINNEVEKTEKKVNNNEVVINKDIFDTDMFKKSASGIQDFLKKVNGGIELKDDDLKETGELGIDTKKYSDDKKPNVLKQAQKEAYELIDTVNALKDTVNTLTPVLQEGKKLMGIFENLKI